MTPLFTKEQYKICRYKEKLPLQCKKCKNTFYNTKDLICRVYKNLLSGGIGIIKNGSKCDFCSRNCYAKYKAINNKTYIKCKNCNKNICIKNSLLNKRIFCSKKCSATYNNKNKKYGNRVSKLEFWLQNQLKIKFPNLLFEFNKKEYIKSELDIYIPSLRLAFELNGIFHYEPIYGKEKLKSIKDNDCRKFQACLENNIELCIINTSNQKHFTEKSSQKYLDIIYNIINLKIKGDISESN